MSLTYLNSESAVRDLLINMFKKNFMLKTLKACTLTDMPKTKKNFSYLLLKLLSNKRDSKIDESIYQFVLFWFVAKIRRKFNGKYSIPCGKP